MADLISPEAGRPRARAATCLHMHIDTRLTSMVVGYLIQPSLPCVCPAILDRRTHLRIRQLLLVPPPRPPLPLLLQQLPLPQPVQRHLPPLVLLPIYIPSLLPTAFLLPYHNYGPVERRGRRGGRLPMSCGGGGCSGGGGVG